MQLKQTTAQLGSMAGFIALALVSQAGNGQFVTAETFDIDRYLPTEDKFQFETFYVEETQSLQSALDAGIVTDDTPLLVTVTAEGALALLTGQMAFHHIAQGTAAGKDWMATF
jgi:hypothetical protein